MEFILEIQGCLKILNLVRRMISQVEEISDEFGEYSLHILFFSWR